MKVKIFAGVWMFWDFQTRGGIFNSGVSEVWRSSDKRVAESVRGCPKYVDFQTKEGGFSAGVCEGGVTSDKD